MDQKNVWIAMAIILVMFFAYQFLYELPRLEREQALLEEQQQQQAEAQTEEPDAVLPDVSTATTGGSVACSDRVRSGSTSRKMRMPRLRNRLLRWLACTTDSTEPSLWRIRSVHA